MLAVISPADDRDTRYDAKFAGSHWLNTLGSQSDSLTERHLVDAHKCVNKCRQSTRLTFRGFAPARPECHEVILQM